MHRQEYKYRVYTPFMFDDGDHYVIEFHVKINERYAYSDTGHTEMHLDILVFRTSKTWERKCIMLFSRTT